MQGRCRVLAMERNAFERLMGPAEESLKKEIEEYTRVNRSLSDGAQARFNTYFPVMNQFLSLFLEAAYMNHRQRVVRNIVQHRSII